MKDICFALIFFVISWTGFAQDSKKWQAGEYVTYHMQWKNGDWESFSFYVNRKIDSKSWELDVIYKIKDRDTLLRLQVPIKNDKNSKPVAPLGSKVLRGAELDDMGFNMILVKIYNILNLRMVNLNSMETKQIQDKFCCNISTAKEFEDKWDEFNYSLFHSMNNSVPILGLVETKKSTGDFTMYLTSFGRNTIDLASYKFFPTFIDIYSLQKIIYPDFSIQYPSSWILKQIPSTVPKNEMWGTQLGGNVHAGYFLIKILTDNTEEILDNFSKSLNVTNNSSFNKDLTFETKLLDKSGKVIHQFGYKTEGQIGKQLVGYFINEKKTKMAEIILFVNFGENNPDRSKLPKILNAYTEILKSFQFN